MMTMKKLKELMKQTNYGDLLPQPAGSEASQKDKKSKTPEPARRGEADRDPFAKYQQFYDSDGDPDKAIPPTKKVGQ